MHESDALPRLRYVDAFPVDVEGQRLIYLRDPEGIASEGLGVPPDVFQVMTLLDGRRTTADLQSLIAGANGGGTVSAEQISTLVATLDDALLLDSDRFRQHKAEVEAAYRAETRRPSPLAGRSYPDAPEALRLLIDSFFHDDEGPKGSAPRGSRVEALIAPHIDFGRGGPCFAWAYNELKGREPADVYVVLGTGHSSRLPFATTYKVFETPLGDLSADRAFIDRLSGHAEQDLLADELAHRNEHSVEFQAVFLKYLFPDAPITFVPILCGSFFQSVESGESPMANAAVADFVNALRKTLAEETRSVCLIAGVDFSHVGQRFGDEVPLDDGFISRVEASDRDLIEAASTGDAEAFFDVIVRDGDRNRVCGTSSIYTMLKVMEGASGRLLDYDQAIDHESQSLVSFASMVFEERDG